MKSRRRQFQKKQDDSQQRFGRGGRERGGRPGNSSGPAPRPAPERPSLLVAQVQDVGAYLRGKVLHRDLVSLDFELVVPDGLAVKHGDFVEAKPVGGRGQKLEVLRLVPPTSAATWAAVCNHGLTVEFPPEVLREVEKLPAYKWDSGEGRTDWRELAIVTIDGEDARDFDDAVWGEKLKNGGFRLIVAIADVAHYVREHSALDTEAVRRGNSTYFPTMVIPMLPERLSNDLCSLRPHEDRPVLGVELWIDEDGKLLKHRFHRACIHSAARLTYNRVETELRGAGKKGASDLAEPVRKNLAVLADAYAALARAREKRGALDLDIPEVKLELGKDGKVANVGVRPRLTSHRLIEEMMILANVAAAEVLSSKGGGGLYRIHPEPSKEKLENLKATMGPLGFTVPAPNGGPKAWAKLVAQINGHPAALTLLRAVLQSQQQAKYDPDNIGHYGLALPLYSHFTSPIRRYADLILHRALIAALELPGEGAAKWPMQKLVRVAEDINTTERKSQMAEWEARDRMVAEHFAGLVGQTFPAVVVSVVPFGCFVAVDNVAEGLLPRWILGQDWAYVGALACWRRIRGGKANLRVGSRLDVMLREADALGGRLTFGMIDKGARNEGRGSEGEKTVSSEATAKGERNAKWQEEAGPRRRPARPVRRK